MSDDVGHVPLGSSDDLPDGLVAVRQDGTVLHANSAFAAQCGRPLAEVIGSDLFDLLEDGRSPGPGRLAGLFVSEGREVSLMRPDGTTTAVELRGRPIAAASGPTYLAVVRERAAVAAEGALVSEVLDTIEDGVAVCDDDGRIVHVNAAARQLFRIASDAAGRRFPLEVELRGADGTPVREEDHPLARALGSRPVVSEHVVVEDGSDRDRHLLVSARPIELGVGRGAVLVAREITTQLDEQARLLELALHDPLTGLANRALLLDHLERSLNRIRSRGGSLALLIVDIDGFRAVNEEHGVDVGDEILRTLALRLQATARSSDLVARLGGDEFVLVASSRALEHDVVGIMTERIAGGLEAPVRVRGRSLAVGTTLAWVLADSRKDDPTTLLVRADRELSRKKRVLTGGGA